MIVSKKKGQLIGGRRGHLYLPQHFLYILDKEESWISLEIRSAKIRLKLEGTVLCMFSTSGFYAGPNRIKAQARIGRTCPAATAGYWLFAATTASRPNLRSRSTVLSVYFFIILLFHTTQLGWMKSRNSFLGFRTQGLLVLNLVWMKSFA